MSDKNNTKVIARANMRGGKGAVRQHTKSRSQTYSGPSIFDQLAADRREELEAIRAEERAKREAKVAERREEFAASHLAFALTAPHIVNDRKNGGVNGDVRILAIRLIRGWAGITAKEATDAKTTRMGLSKRRLINALLDEFIAEEAAKVAKAEQSVDEAVITAAAADRLAKLDRKIPVAERAAYAAVDYGFRKAKEAELAVKLPANQPSSTSAAKPSPTMFVRRAVKTA